MRKMILLVAAVMLVAAMSIPATASADMSTQLRFHENITCSEAGCWVGTVTGDVAGKVEFGPDPDHENWGIGAALHFYEAFTIEPASGGYIKGVDAGVYNLKSGMYMANGWVTDTSDEYEYLMGWKFHERGITTDPSDPVVIGEGDAFLAMP